jgi:hypothetical protein
MAMASTHAGDSRPSALGNAATVSPSQLSSAPRRRPTWPLVVAVGLLVAAATGGLVAKSLSSSDDETAPAATPSPEARQPDLAPADPPPTATPAATTPDAAPVATPATSDRDPAGRDRHKRPRERERERERKADAGTAGGPSPPW